MIGQQAPDMPVLTTARLRLEPLVVGHAEAMFEVLCDPLLHVHLDRPPPPSLDHLRATYARLEARRSPDGSERWLNWVIVASDTAIGFVQATVLADASAWIAYLIARPRQGQGYAAEATGAMLDHLGDDAGVTRFQATVEMANAPSIALLERLGFRQADVASREEGSLTEWERLFVKSVDRPSR